MNDLPIGPGCRVTLHLRLALANGAVVEDSFGGEPMHITMGEGDLVQGLELALYGLAEGAEESVQIPAIEAFGFPDEDKLHWMARSEFADEVGLEEGAILGFTTPAGDEVPGRIVEITAEQVRVDFNHPLAGHDLLFSVQILSVEPPDGTHYDA